MSELNLIPNPQLMLAQAVVFFTQVYVINRFLVVPFSKLKALRSSATDGADSKSEELAREIKLVSGEIQTLLSKTHEEIKKIKESGRLEAKKAREAEIAQAQKEMGDLVNEARKNVQKDLQEERQKIHSLSDRFADDLYAKLCRES